MFHLLHPREHDYARIQVRPHIISSPADGKWRCCAAKGGSNHMSHTVGAGTTAAAHGRRPFPAAPGICTSLHLTPPAWTAACRMRGTHTTHACICLKTTLCELALLVWSFLPLKALQTSWRRRTHLTDGKLTLTHFGGNRATIFAALLPLQALHQRGGGQRCQLFERIRDEVAGILMVECFLVLQTQALHQLEAADNSADGKLTLNEMISNPYVFYGSSGASTCTKWKYMHLTVHETNDILIQPARPFFGATDAPTSLSRPLRYSFNPRRSG